MDLVDVATGAYRYTATVDHLSITNLPSMTPSKPNREAIEDNCEDHSTAILTQSQADDEGRLVDPIALYYPYIHVRDDTWLKYAAMYWPKMARLRPHDYATPDWPVARALQNEAGWLIDITPPPWAANEVGLSFLELIETHAQALRDRFGLNRPNFGPHLAAASPQSVCDPAVGYVSEKNSVIGYDIYGAAIDTRLSYVHVDKTDADMIKAAIDADLAIPMELVSGTWVGMHPELASVYICALIERIATEDRLHPITDQILPHSALSGWTMDRLAQVLINNRSDDTQHPRVPHGLLDAFVFLAFETVLPANLDTVPVEKIIEIRSEFGTELIAFREYVTQQAQRLAELENVRDLAVFQEYLRTEVRQTVTSQLNQLRERLRSVGLESARALINVKSVGLPPLAAMAAETIGLPPIITGSAVLASCVVTAPTRWRRQRQVAVHESPVGYLFQIDRTLNPANMIDRLRRTWPT